MNATLNESLKSFLENIKGVGAQLYDPEWKWDHCADPESCKIKEECDCYDWSEQYRIELSKGRLVFDWDSGLTSDYIEEKIQEWCEKNSMKYSVEYFEIIPCDWYIGSVELKV